jgi:hypothetical protein
MKAKAKQRATRKPRKNPYGMIDFSFGDTLYQIDPQRRKVYHRWVEVETAKTSLIMGAFSSAATAVAK